MCPPIIGITFSLYQTAADLGKVMRRFGFNNPRTARFILRVAGLARKYAQREACPEPVEGLQYE